MGFLADLWLPILLSSAFVFVVSSVIHMMLPWHKGDYARLAGEAEVLAAMRAQGVTPGTYMFPCPGSMKEMCAPEMVAKFEQGPVGFMTVKPSGAPTMGKSLVQWFLYSLLISAFAAYVGHLALAPAAGFMMALRVTGAVAVLGHAVSVLQESIWKGQPWWITLKFVVDGVVYGIVTGLTFGWLWPRGAWTPL